MPDTIRLGFTGTRQGLTDAQRDALYTYIHECPAFSEVHHGACLGADAEFVDMIHEQGDEGWVCQIIAHPGDQPEMTDIESLKRSDLVLPRKPMFQRDRDIVNASTILLACPKGPEEVRSGTWSTIRYARRTPCKIVIFWPDGKVQPA